MSIVCLEQDRGITGCTYIMQSAIYIMCNTHFINIYFITTYCNCMEYFTLLIYSSLPLLSLQFFKTTRKTKIYPTHMVVTYKFILIFYKLKFTDNHQLLHCYLVQ